MRKTSAPVGGRGACLRKFGVVLLAASTLVGQHPASGVHCSEPRLSRQLGIHGFPSVHGHLSWGTCPTSVPAGSRPGTREISAAAHGRLRLRGGGCQVSRAVPGDETLDEALDRGGTGGLPAAGASAARELAPQQQQTDARAAQKAAELAERRADKAERRAAELEHRLDQLEEEFCQAEAGLVQARATSAQAASKAEKQVRAELDARIAALNERCNQAEAEVRWGNGERTRDLIIITELKHKIDEHEQERGELEDKIRREFAADGVACGGAVTGAGGGGVSHHQDAVRTPSIPVEGWPEDVEEGGLEDTCWCGAHGDEGGDVAGDNGWTGLEGDEQEGPVVLVHQETCARTPQSAPGETQTEKVAEDENDALTPLQLLDKLRKAQPSSHV